MIVDDLTEQKLLKRSVKIKRNLPANINDKDLGFYEDFRSYETLNCYLKLIKNASVFSNSIVYQRGFLVNETLFSQSDKTYYQFRFPLKRFLTYKKINLNQNKKYLLATDSESVGHFHWFIETLPRLMRIRDIADEFVLLLPDKPYIKEIAVKSLELLKLNFEDLLLMKESEFYQAKNLYYVSKVCRTGEMSDELMQEINSLFLSGKKTGNNKIYISREKAAFRKVLNENDFVAMLKSYGFESLFAEDLSLSEEVDLFSSCKTLLSIHGAGLTNCIFMSPGSRVIELRKNEINTGYWYLADSLNQKYFYYNGIPDTEKSLIGRGCNLTISLSDFEKEILTII